MGSLLLKFVLIGSLLALTQAAPAPQRFQQQPRQQFQFQQPNRFQQPRQQFQQRPQFQQQRQQFQQQRPQFQQPQRFQQRPQQFQQPARPQQFQVQQQQPVVQASNSFNRHPDWLDTSHGRYAQFDGPVKGIPKDHGGGRFGAADCLLC